MRDHLKYVLAILPFLASFPAASEAVAEAGFAGVEEGEFQELFNKWATDLSMESRLKSLSCTDENQRTCFYAYRSIIITASETPDGKGLKSVAIICGRECVLPDVVSATAVGLRVLAPREPPQTFGNWLKGATTAAAAESPYQAEIGPVRLVVPWLGTKLTAVYLTVKADGLSDRPDR